MSEQNVSVPRELLARALSAIEQVGYQDKFIDYAFTGEVKRELCRTLAAPTEDVRAVGEEPVAYADPKSFENFNNLAHLGGLYTHEWMWAKPAAGLVPLYRHPQRPVVLPERNAAMLHIDLDQCGYGYVDGWNACIDEFERLNK